MSVRVSTWLGVMVPFLALFVSACGSSAAVTQAQAELCDLVLDDQLKASLGDAEANPTPHNLNQVMAQADGIKDCIGPGLLDPQRVAGHLMALRAAIVAYYVRGDKYPVTTARGLGSGSNESYFASVPRETGDPDVRLTDTPNFLSWSEHYVWAERLLRRLAKDEAEAKRWLRHGQLPYAWVRTDALTGMLAARLDATAAQQETRASEELIDWLFGAWRESVVNEVGLWQPPAPDGSVRIDAGTLDPKQMERIKNWDLMDRAAMIGRHAQRICQSWQAKPDANIRGALGAGTAIYLRELRGKLNEPALAIEWPVIVENGLGGLDSEDGTVARIDDIYRDISAFDSLNLCGYFATRQAQSQWLGLLSPKLKGARMPWADGLFEDAMVGQAADALIHASDWTEDRHVRLRSVARLVNLAEIIDSMEGFASAGTRDATPVRRGRQLAGRRLAELSLCEMNRALLDAEELPPCEFPTKEQRRVEKPAFVPLAEAFRSTGDDKPRAPVVAEVAEAYAHVIGALRLPVEKVATKEASIGAQAGRANDAGETPVASNTEPLPPEVAAELAAILDQRHLGFLGLRLSTYRNVVVMLSGGQLTLPAAQEASILAQAFELVGKSQERLCADLALRGKRCSASGLLEAIALQDNDQMFRVRLAEAYCELAAIGSGLYRDAVAKIPNGSRTLLDRTEGGLPEWMPRTRIESLGASYEQIDRNACNQLPTARGDVGTTAASVPATPTEATRPPVEPPPASAEPRTLGPPGLSVTWNCRRPGTSGPLRSCDRAGEIGKDVEVAIQATLERPALVYAFGIRDGKMEALTPTSLKGPALDGRPLDVPGWTSGQDYSALWVIASPVELAPAARTDPSIWRDPTSMPPNTDVYILPFKGG